MDTLDWDNLAKSMENDGKIPYEPNRHLFTKVAFDVFQMNGSPIDILWKLEDDESGKQYLVALYEDNLEEKLNSKSSWLTLSDKNRQNVTLFYKDMPIQRFASTDYGFSPGDIHLFQQILVKKLSSDKNFLKKLLNTQSEEKQEQILKAFPELV